MTTTRTARPRTRLARHAAAPATELEALRRPRRSLRARQRRAALLRRLGRRVLAVVAIGAAVVIGAGVALAYVLGTGSSSGATAQVVPAGLTASIAEVDGLFPGATASAAATIVNTGPYPVAIATLAAPSEPCAAVLAPSSLPTIPAGGTATVTLPVTMPTGAPDFCQGTDVTLDLDVRGTTAP